MASIQPGAELRIAQVAPLFVRVPPARYGGTERVIATLTDELVRRGHEVTLFAAGTSQTSAWLAECSPKPVWGLAADDAAAYHVGQVDEVIRKASRFDVIHWHTGYLHWLAADRAATPSLTTIHGRADTDSVRRLFASHPHEPFASISDAQRRPLANLGVNWIRTVYNGLDLEHTYPLGRGDGGYLAFVGRSSPEKGLATAIRIAIRCGIPIKIAARIEPGDLEYHRNEVVPLLDHCLVEWLGEATEAEKVTLLAGACALIVPIEWDEPFGLVFVEALAAGTPVITRPLGALPEIMRDGDHGHFALSEDGFVDACRRLRDIDRGECRRWALERFSARRMADDYEIAYARVMRDAGVVGDPVSQAV